MFFLDENIRQYFIHWFHSESCEIAELCIASPWACTVMLWKQTSSFASFVTVCCIRAQLSGSRFLLIFSQFRADVSADDSWTVIKSGKKDIFFVWTAVSVMYSGFQFPSQLRNK